MSTENTPSSVESTPTASWLQNDQKDDSKGNDISENSLKPKSTRRSVACKSCHALKVKCMPADENNPAGPCIRCLKSKRKCEIDLTQTRKRRKKADNNGDGVTTPINATKQEKMLSKLQAQNEELRSQIRNLNHKLIRQEQNNNNGSSGSEDRYISKNDLERELSVFCQSSSSKLTEMTNSLKYTAERRRELLSRSQNPDLISSGMITKEEAASRLKMYREMIYAAYPLIDVPESMTVEDLQAHQPFLLNAIISITTSISTDSENIDRALEIDNEAVKSIVTEVLVAGSKSDELIKSLVLLCLWYNTPDLFRHRRYHLLNSISVSLMHDLGIIARPFHNFKQVADTVKPLDVPNPNKVEYRKIVMVLYFTTVSVCLILRRTIYVRWTQFVEECCSEIEKNNDTNSQNLALLSRLSYQLERIHHIVHAVDSSEKRKSTSEYVIRELQSNLSALRSKIHPDDHAFLAYYFSIEAYLHEPVLSEIVEDTSRLPENSVRSISNCTTSCLNAIDEFNKMSPNDIALMPLFYASRIIYTAGMLLRLRYLILSLPSYIERDLVPQDAVTSLHKLTALIEKAANLHTLNHFLKKIRLVLHLFIQTYATQVQELIHKHGETPQNFKPTRREISEMDQLNELMLNIDKKDPTNALGSNTSAAESRGDLSGETPRAHDISQPPDESFHRTSLSIPNMVSNQMQPPQFRSGISPSFVNGDGQSFDNNMNVLNPPYDIANADQLENSFLALNDEFWVNLLSTDSEKLNFSNNNEGKTASEEVFFMNN
ncbi:uncharacterized protein PRCAT00003762001 [Priceomyces carsonii]|uniref:uncharacterized protein n=1 Tax=Priceomyces carsonii TaxID=28549 RepID=UPI002ED85029|nr:unnamed protein product [Priceomyces carsonii]